MIKKYLSSVLMVAGFTILGFSIISDAIIKLAVGREPTGIGPHQIVGIFIGIILITIGWLRKHKEVQ